MKSLSVLILSFIFTVSAYAQKSNDLFEYDEQQIKTEFKQLNQIEQYVNSHEGVSADEMGTKTDLLKNIEISKIATFNVKDNTLPLLPPFWWGCLLGGIGILLVYLITEDSNQTKRALTGCLVWGGVVALFYVVYAVAILSSGV